MTSYYGVASCALAGHYTGCRANAWCFRMHTEATLYLMKWRALCSGPFDRAHHSKSWWQAGPSNLPPFSSTLALFVGYVGAVQWQKRRRLRRKVDEGKALVTETTQRIPQKVDECKALVAGGAGGVRGQVHHRQLQNQCHGAALSWPPATGRRRQGRLCIARHVVQLVMNPRLLS